MRKFEITFEREVHTTDRFTRIIEADSEDEARRIGEGACGAYDMDCPDDAAPIGDGHDCQSWDVVAVEAAADDAEADELPTD